MAFQPLLRQIYYNPDTGFGTQAETLRQARAVDSTVTANDVQQFMRAQTLTQFRPVRGKNSFVPPEARFQFQFDVAYMHTVSGGAYKFALIAIDVFSNKLLVIPQRTRRAEETAQSLEAVLAKLGMPAYALTDAGSEFKGSFKKSLNYYGIPHYETRTHAVFAERAIRTVKEALVKRVRSLGGYWYKYIDTVVERYNKRTHSATHMSPNSGALLENRTEVRQNLQEIAKHAKTYPNLEVGDAVRVIKKPLFGASYRTTEDAWSRDVFSVADIRSTDMGKIYTLSEQPAQTFTRNELLKVSGTEAPPVEAEAAAAQGPSVRPGGRLRRIPPERLFVNR